VFFSLLIWSLFYKALKKEHEQLLIYDSIRLGVMLMPEALPAVYVQLLPKMTQVITSSQNQQMITSVLHVMESMFPCVNDPNIQSKFDMKYLRQIGFDGLPESDKGFPDNEKTKKNNKLIKNIACYLVETMLGDEPRR